MIKNYILLPLIVIFFISCASSYESYDTFSHRDSDFVQTNIAISERGLTQEQISAILSTRFPPQQTVSIAVIFLQRFNSRSLNNLGLPFYIINQGRNINNVEKFVPIPRLFIPNRLTFDTIQDLGIRSLCEYTLIFNSSTNRTMTFRQWVAGEHQFESDIEFFLIDNQTTAIIASDRLYSSFVLRRQHLNDNDITEAEDILYTMQAELLAEKLNALFRRN